MRFGQLFFFFFGDVNLRSAVVFLCQTLEVLCNQEVKRERERERERERREDNFHFKGLWRSSEAFTSGFHFPQISLFLHLGTSQSDLHFLD